MRSSTSYRATPETTALKAQVRHLHENTTMSAREMAKELGVTSGVVSGHIHRLKLPPGPQLVFSPRPNRPRTPPKPKEPPPVIDAPISLNLDLMDVRDGQCRYVHGDGPFAFCGRETQPKSKYCPYHHAACYAPIQPKRQETAE